MRNTQRYLRRGSQWVRSCVLGESEKKLIKKQKMGLPSSSAEKATATHSSTLAWKLPWMEEPGRLKSMGLWRVGHEWATSLSLFTFMHWRRKWQPTSVFLPGESQGRRSLVGCRLWGRRVGHDWSNLAAAVASSSEVKNLSANAGDTGLIPDLGRSCMPQSNKPMCHNYWASAPEPGSHVPASAVGARGLRRCRPQALGRTVSAVVAWGPWGSWQ